MSKQIKCSGTLLFLGQQGEHLAVEIAFPQALQWRELYGAGEFSLWHRRPDEEAIYPCRIRMENGIPIWEVTAFDTAVASHPESFGKAELRLYVGEVIVKSEVFSTVIAECLTGDEMQVPQTQRSWVEDVLLAAERVEASQNRLPQISEAKTWLLWDAQTQAYRDSGILAEGRGTAGADGYTPVRGVDYYTEADKAEIVAAVLAALQNGDEVSY